MTPIEQKGWQEDAGSHSLLPSVPGRDVEQIIGSHSTCSTARDQAQPAWLCERQVLPAQPDLLL